MKSFTIPVDVFEAKVKFIVDFTIEQCHCKIEEDEQGCCFKEVDGDCEIWLWSSKDFRSLVHECSHATSHILGIRSIDNEECHCYLLDYLVGRYADKMNFAFDTKK